MSRSKYKGPFFKVNFIKKKWIRIKNKNLTILPEYIKHSVSIYNGKRFINLKIKKNMIGFKFGEFIYTRKKHIYIKKKKINYGSKNYTN